MVKSKPTYVARTCAYLILRHIILRFYQITIKTCPSTSEMHPNTATIIGFFNEAIVVYICISRFGYA